MTRVLFARSLGILIIFYNDFDVKIVIKIIPILSHLIRDYIDYCAPMILYSLDKGIQCTLAISVIGFLMMMFAVT